MYFYTNDKIVWGSVSSEYGWYVAEGLYSSGETLEEMVKNAYSIKVDRNGEEVGFAAIEELPQDAVKMLQDYWDSKKR